MPSAPSPSQTRAISPMSVTFGESFTSSGSCVARRTARHQLAQQLGSLAELDAAALHVRARRVQLDPGHARRAGQTLGDLGITLDLGLEDARDHRHALGSAGSFSRTKASTPTFSRLIALSMPAGASAMRARRVPAARLEREALRDEAADPREVEERRELGAVAEGARRGQHRIAQRDAAQIDARVDFAHAQAPPRRRRCAGSTGPSRHTSAKPPPRAAPRSRGRRRSRTPSGSRARPSRRSRARAASPPPRPHHRGRPAGVDAARAVALASAPSSRSRHEPARAARAVLGGDRRARRRARRNRPRPSDRRACARRAARARGSRARAAARASS